MYDEDEKATAMLLPYPPTYLRACAMASIENLHAGGTRTYNDFLRTLGKEKLLLLNNHMHKQDVSRQQLQFTLDAMSHKNLCRFMAKEKLFQSDMFKLPVMRDIVKPEKIFNRQQLTQKPQKQNYIDLESQTITTNTTNINNNNTTILTNNNSIILTNNITTLTNTSRLITEYDSDNEEDNDPPNNTPTVVEKQEVEPQKELKLDIIDTCNSIGDAISADTTPSLFYDSEDEQKEHKEQPLEIVVNVPQIETVNDISTKIHESTTSMATMDTVMDDVVVIAEEKEPVLENDKEKCVVM